MAAMTVTKSHLFFHSILDEVEEIRSNVRTRRKCGADITGRATPRRRDQIDGRAAVCQRLYRRRSLRYFSLQRDAQTFQTTVQPTVNNQCNSIHYYSHRRGIPIVFALHSV